MEKSIWELTKELTKEDTKEDRYDLEKTAWFKKLMEEK